MWTWLGLECNGPDGWHTTGKVGREAGPIVAWVRFAVCRGDVEDLHWKFAEVIFHAPMLYTCRLGVVNPLISWRDLLHLANH